ncbi:GCR1-dependent translation factor 1 [Paecilomyces lecythidis]|uniref:GCR1-dependent translation factor 1 n=1 Tax=Paecilomyces lecythidis TaxID=3004212 RepID=A0ABR3X3H2_9EURO
MKFARFSPSLALLLLQIIPATIAERVPDNGVSTTVLDRREASSADVALSAPEILASPKAAPKGTLDAPIDGKDGLPHQGPWVETGADRDRKKAKEADPKDAFTTSGEKVAAADKLASEGKPIPHSNDGVMDDPHRVGPKEGTRGTEGGVSEKSKSSKLASDKVPGAPKEAPPLPHSEQVKIPAADESSSSKDPKSADGGAAILEKPADLPEKPHDIPPPKSPAHVKGDQLAIDTAKSSKGKSSSVDPAILMEESSVISPIHSLILSFTMIIFSEIGDKTFLVAALMAMRHPRLLVFSAAFSALITMTVLSAVLGHAVPTLIPKSFTNFLAALLFLVFGAKMLKEAREMSPDEGVSEEMKEVEMELEEKEQQQNQMSRRRSSISPYALEAGRVGGRRKSRSSAHRLPSPPDSPSSSSSRSSSPAPSASWRNVLVGFNNLFSFLLTPAWVQTFVMTFLGEWGDRSQIATIAMAAGQDYWWVTVGAISGHGICTAAAVIGGRAIAGRVSMRVVTLGGAISFLIFGLIYLFEAIY